MFASDFQQIPQAVVDRVLRSRAGDRPHVLWGWSTIGGLGVGARCRCGWTSLHVPRAHEALTLLEQHVGHARVLGSC